MQNDSSGMPLQKPDVVVDVEVELVVSVVVVVVVVVVGVVVVEVVVQPRRPLVTRLNSLCFG